MAIYFKAMAQTNEEKSQPMINGEISQAAFQ